MIANTPPEGGCISVDDVAPGSISVWEHSGGVVLMCVSHSHSLRMTDSQSVTSTQLSESMFKDENTCANAFESCTTLPIVILRSGSSQKSSGAVRKYGSMATVCSYVPSHSEKMANRVYNLV